MEMGSRLFFLNILQVTLFYPELTTTEFGLVLKSIKFGGKSQNFIPMMLLLQYVITQKDALSSYKM